jgi:Mn-dependent DtxR family transcriptional regulator
MAVVATSIYLIAALFAPEKGLIARYRASRVQQLKIEMEDMVKAAFKLEQFTLEQLGSQLGFNASKARRLVARLKAARLMTVSDGVLELTDEGVERAKGLIRAHRLWESYLVSEVGLTSEQIHEDAEQLEHHLSDDILDEVDRMLGYPTLDPHGSPIPPKGTVRTRRLDQFKVNESVIILEDQDSDKATHLLWELGIDPSSRVMIREIDQNDVLIAVNGKDLRIPLRMAARIAVAPLAYSSSDPI